MRPRQTAREAAPRAPVGAQVVLEFAVQVELEDAVEDRRDHPDGIVLVDEDADRVGDVGPLVEVLAVLGEDLDAVVGAVAHVDAAVPVHREPVHQVELARTAPEFAPLHQILALGVVLDDARVPVAIAHQKVTARQERHHRGVAVLVRARVRVGARLRPGGGVIRIDEPHHQLAPVVRELEDLHVDVLAAAALHDPHVALGVVGADVELMRLVEDRVPLGPVLGDVAVPVHGDDVVGASLALAPLGVPVAPDTDDDPVRVVDRHGRDLSPDPGLPMVRRGLPPAGYGVVLAGPVVAALGHRPRWRRLHPATRILGRAGGQQGKSEGHQNGWPHALDLH